MNTREIEPWIRLFESEHHVRFSEGLRETLRLAMGAFSAGVSDLKGIISPGLFLACTQTGKSRPGRDHLLAALYRIVGEERYAQMATGFNKGELAGTEIDELINVPYPTVSSFVLRMFSRAAELIPKDRHLLLPVDWLVALVESLGQPEDRALCAPLVHKSESFRELLYRWLIQLSNEQGFPTDLESRLRRMDFSADPMASSQFAPGTSLSPALAARSTSGNQPSEESPALDQQPRDRVGTDTEQEVTPTPEPGVARPKLDSATRTRIVHFWNSMSVSPSNGVRNAFEYACAEGGLNRKSLIPWNLLLGLVQDGKNVSDWAGQRHGDLQVLLFEKVQELNPEWSSMWITQSSQDEKNPAILEVGTDLRRTLERAFQISQKVSPAEVYLAARHVVAALIEHFGPQGSGRMPEGAKITADHLVQVLREHLPLYEGDDLEKEWEKFFSDLSNQRSRRPKGAKFVARREALDDELCLDIEPYSLALREMFENAVEENDFVLGLFAPWGRGKTTLMKAVARLLSGTRQCIYFSASKYPTRPEVWVHLYQTISKAATAGGFAAAWRLKIRIGLLRNGWMPLLFGAYLTAFSLVERVGHGTKATIWTLNALGVVGAILLGGFIYRMCGLGGLIKNTYGELPDHSDKLGLQAIIGDDLERLLKAWIPAKCRPPFPVRSTSSSDEEPGKFWGGFFHEGWPVDFRLFRCGWLALIAFVAGMCWASIQASCSILKHLPKLSEAASPLSSPGHWLAILPLFAGLFVAIIAFLIAHSKNDNKPALLIVDDLDRCDPDQSLAVIESIRWFLDKPEVSSRLQVAMLMERTALEAACRMRAEDVGFSVEDSDWPRRFQDHREKLFVIELSLAAIDEDDLRDLVTSVVDGEERRIREKKRELAREEHRNHAPAPKASRTNETVRRQKYHMAEQIGETDVTVTTSSVKNPTPKELENYSKAERDLEAEHQRQLDEVTVRRRQSNEVKAEINAWFSDEERSAFKQVFKGVSPTRLTPRSVRAAVSRYQFARRILHLKGIDFDEVDLMERLLARLFDDSSAPPTASDDDPIGRVIEQLV